MEIRKLTNPWSDDIMALVQALPLRWSEEDEMHIKPVDLVRDNDFENPEIGVTYRKDLFVNVTHWRYTSQVDQYRKAFSGDLAEARRLCFTAEWRNAKFKPSVDAPAITRGAIIEVDKVINDIDFATAEKRIYADLAAKASPPRDIRQEWAYREGQRQGRMREDAIKQTLGERYEEAAGRLRAGEAMQDVLSEEEIARVKASLIPVNEQIQRDMDALQPMGRIWRPTYVIPKGGNDGED